MTEPELEIVFTPRGERRDARNTLAALLYNELFPLFRLGYSVLSPGADVPPLHALALLARQLQLATKITETDTIITVEQTMGRASLAAVVLPVWLSIRKRRATDILGVVRTRPLAMEYKRRFKRLSTIWHCRKVWQNVVDDFRYRRLAPTPEPEGVVTWEPPFSGSQTRTLNNIVVVDPLSKEDSADHDCLTHFIRHLREKRLAAVSRNRYPSVTVLAEPSARGGLRDRLVDLGYDHIHIPTVANGLFEMEVADNHIFEYPHGRPVVIKPYTAYELAQLKRSMPAAAWEATYT